MKDTTIRFRIEAQLLEQIKDDALDAGFSTVSDYLRDLASTRTLERRTVPRKAKRQISSS